MSAKNAVALFAGILFGAGLVVSGMTDTSKVLGFLDVSRDWNPALALVMIGAIGVFLPGRLLFLRHRKEPLLDSRFHEPPIKTLDSRLIGGALLFGVGWGLSGVCPGPGIVNAATGALPFVVFMGTMTLGILATRLIDVGLTSRVDSTTAR